MLLEWVLGCGLFYKNNWYYDNCDLLDFFDTILFTVLFVHFFFYNEKYETFTRYIVYVIALMSLYMPIDYFVKKDVFFAGYLILLLSFLFLICNVFIWRNMIK